MRHLGHVFCHSTQRMAAGASLSQATLPCKRTSRLQAVALLQPSKQNDTVLADAQAGVLLESKNAMGRLIRAEKNSRRRRKAILSIAVSIKKSRQNVATPPTTITPPQSQE